MIKNKFTKSKIATSLSFILGATALPAISAEEVSKQATEQEIEVIQVSGIRGSNRLRK